ncbi:MAG: hypothetical protein Q8Q36_02025 [bacterium]|nr:hypothetical protein [bacterium]
MEAVLIFLFALGLLATMVLFRVWELRAGRFDKKEVAARELTISPAHVEHWNSKFFEAILQLAHFIMVLLVRAVIGILLIIRREAKRLSTKLDQFFLAGNGHARGPASFYLQNLSGYKDAKRTTSKK